MLTLSVHFFVLYQFEFATPYENENEAMDNPLLLIHTKNKPPYT